MYLPRQATLEISIFQDVIIIMLTLQQATQEYTPLVYMGLWAESGKLHMKT